MLPAAAAPSTTSSNTATATTPPPPQSTPVKPSSNPASTNTKSKPTTNTTRRSARVRQHDPIQYPGFGTAKDLRQLQQQLSQGQPCPLPLEAVETVMRSRGRGLRSSNQDEEKQDGTTGNAAVNSHAWADFMQEQGVAAAPQEPAAEEQGRGKRQKTKQTTAASTSTSKGRDYQLPLVATKPSPPGNLVQSGTLDAATVGRTKLQLDAEVWHVPHPTILSLDNKIQIQSVWTGPNAVHSIAIEATHGHAYGWGRNESHQLGLDERNVAFPTLLEGLIEHGPVVQAACGKSHTLFVVEPTDNTDTNQVWAVGANKVGQCGVKNYSEVVTQYKQCVFADSETPTQIHQVACGEDFSVVLDSQGMLYTTGSSEFGQLGNGETGEYFVTANKLAFSNCNVFTARTIFCHAPHEKLHVNSTQSAAVLPLAEDSIRLSSIACGKHHTVAVEAPPSTDDKRRVFSWGCGNYGVLGHGVQADEYLPRQIGIFSVVLPANKDDVHVSAGAHCSLLRLASNGHVYYWGKHRSVGEATMRPTLVDVLAHNGHVVTHCAAGGQSVVCTTQAGQTVVWGQGPHGELGLETAKSSAKPAFVPALEETVVSHLACGYGHTLYVVPESKPKKLELNVLTQEDVQGLVEKNANEKPPAVKGGGKKKKKTKGK